MGPHFFLVGNGPYLNRGCEAIVRGTVKLIEHSWGSDFRITQGIIGSEEIVSQQALRETDPRITHLPVRIYARRPSLIWGATQLHRLVGYHGPRLRMKPEGVDAALSKAEVVLEVGGDNYSLHFNRYPPYPVVDIDHYIMARYHLPIVIWGASIGPFDAMPHVARKMLAHLRRVSAITVRETVTLDYLRKNDVQSNVHLVADPAFLMEPSVPEDWEAIASFAAGAIGVNVSPLLAPYVTNGEMSAWVDLCARVVVSVVKEFNSRVLLIPHVTLPEASDYRLMAKVVARVYGSGCTRDDVRLLEDKYSAAELAFIIGQLAAFVGARMHATIAALSSGVPTVGLAYSPKSIGVFRDVYGNDDYCIHARDIAPETVTERVRHLLRENAQIRELLLSKLSGLRQRALSAAEIVRQVLGAPTTAV